MANCKGSVCIFHWSDYITLFYIVIADPRYTRLATSWPASRWEVLKIHSLEIAKNMVLVNSGLYQQLLTTVKEEMIQLPEHVRNLLFESEHVTGEKKVIYNLPLISKTELY